ncbi:hypothetical protein niasHT_035898 [Heterodera trifolii]|uniref:FHA domain-containing protein n=1 Tax=Heterodera trifolii TaxID=157864 RepID=A0ABD2IAB8_9BILA
MTANSAPEIWILKPCSESHPFDERRIVVARKEVKIGRANALCQPSTNNAFFDCKVLSHNHAVLWLDGAGHLMIKDTGSANGTFLNTERLSVRGEFSEPRLLSCGDILQLGLKIIDTMNNEASGCVTCLVWCAGRRNADCGTFSTHYTIILNEHLYALEQSVKEAKQREIILEEKLQAQKQGKVMKLNDREMSLIKTAAPTTTTTATQVPDTNDEALPPKTKEAATQVPDINEAPPPKSKEAATQVPDTNDEALPPKTKEAATQVPDINEAPPPKSKEAATQVPDINEAPPPKSKEAATQVPGGDGPLPLLQQPVPPNAIVKMEAAIQMPQDGPTAADEMTAVVMAIVVLVFLIEFLSIL